MACVPACPSGVQYGRLIETTRAHVEEHHRRTPGDRLLRRLIFEVLPHRRRLRAALALRRLPAPGPLAPLAAVAPPWRSSAWPAEHLPGRGPRVAVMAGCVQSVVFGDVNAATARVLAADGYDVHVPRAQSCCGALHAHAGRLADGVARARKLAEDLSGYDAIVDQRRRLRLAPQGPRDPQRRRRVGAARRPAVAGRAASARLRVAFQDSCHLQHAQRIASEPRAALQAIPSLVLLEPAEQDLCCGSAGIYNLVQPEAAQELGDRKAEQVLATEPEAYASGNPGCLVQVDCGATSRRPAGCGVPSDRAGRCLDPRPRGAGGRWRRRAASGSRPRAPRPRRRRGRSHPRRATARSRPAGAPSRRRRCTTRARPPRRDRPSRRRRASSTRAR